MVITSFSKHMLAVEN